VNKSVLALEPLQPELMARLQDRLTVRVAVGTSPLELEREVQEVHGVIVRLKPLPASVIEAGRRLEVIGRTGAGVDNIDVGAATARAIPVVFVPEANSNSVAEYVVGAILMLARHSLTLDREVRTGNWAVRDRWVGHELNGKTLGLIGLGKIGTRVAKICRAAFEMKVTAYDPYLSNEAAKRIDVQRTESLDALLQQADVVSIHVPLTAETKGLIGQRELSLMKPTAYLVNAARGSIVDDEALFRRLQEKGIAGAALDVFSVEPPDASHPLFRLPQVVVSPHIAGVTRDSTERMARTLAQDVLTVLSGGRPRYLANPELFAGQGEP